MNNLHPSYVTLQCGRIFCSLCSDNVMQLASSAKPVRVCDSCYTSLLQRCSGTGMGTGTNVSGGNEDATSVCSYTSPKSNENWSWASIIKKILSYYERWLLPKFYILLKISLIGIYISLAKKLRGNRNIYLIVRNVPA